MHRDKRIFEIIRQRIFLKTFPFGPVYFYSGVSYNCNLLTLQISIDILSMFFNKQSFAFMLPFIYFIYLHLIHLCCKLSVILISPVIPLLIVPSGYVIRGGALTLITQLSFVDARYVTIVRHYESVTIGCLHQLRLISFHNWIR